MVPSNLKNIKGQNITCIMSNLNDNIVGIVEDISDEEIVLFHGQVETFLLSDICAIIQDKKVIYASKDFINDFYHGEIGNITDDEKRILYVFFQIVDGYPVNYGFKNNNLCIKKINNYWYVFDVIDNEIINISKYFDLFYLVTFLFNSLNDNYDSKKVWLMEFKRLIKKEHYYINEDYFLKKFIKN